MKMSAVETIRDIPVIVEHRKGYNYHEPMMIDHDHDYTESGFPFDNSRRTRDPLEDIAQRHPELAQHLQGFPRRSQRGGEQNDDEFLRRRFERPFSGGRFERFGFPFDRDDFEREPQRYYEAYPEHFESFQNQQPQSPSHSQQQAQQPQQPQARQQQQSSSQTPHNFQEHPPQYSQQYQPQSSQQYQPPHSEPYKQSYSPEAQESQQSQQQPQYHSQVTQGTQTEGEEAVQETEGATPEQKSEVGQTRGRPIQQSNTCDLGQSSPDEAVDERNQRSMSLPPENKRFTSSINIPMGGHQGQENGAKPQSQSGSSGSTERVIPIHVEGRDDPVLPKNFTTTSSSPHPPHPQPQPERIFTDAPRPQPERIFGQRPEHFTQFVNRDRFPSDWHNPFERDFPEEDFGFGRAGSPSRYGGAKQPHQTHQQQAHGAPQYQQHKQEAPPQGHASPPQKPPTHEHHEPAQNEGPQQPKPQQQPLGPIEQIQAIQKDVSNLIRQVEVFNGMPRDKNYLYLDEMLTRNLLKLDNVDTQGQDAIRQARKEAIKCIEKTISHLEAKAASNAATQSQNMEVEQPLSRQEGENMDTEPSQETSAMDVLPSSSQQPECDSQGEGNKRGEGVQQSKSNEMVANTEAQTKTEEQQLEVKNGQKICGSECKEGNQGEAIIDKNAEPQQKSEEEVSQEMKNDVGEIKEEKKEKKKIKKKVNKEDKEMKQ